MHRVSLPAGIKVFATRKPGESRCPLQLALHSMLLRALEMCAFSNATSQILVGQVAGFPPFALRASCLDATNERSHLDQRRHEPGEGCCRYTIPSTRQKLSPPRHSLSFHSCGCPASWGPSICHLQGMTIVAVSSMYYYRRPMF